MKLSSGLRLILSALLLAVAVGVIWWVVGFPLGKGFLAGGGEAFFRRQFAFDEGTAMRLAFLAMVVTFTAQAVPAGAKWLPLGAIAAVAALLEPERGAASAFSIFLLVVSVSGVDEMGSAVRQLVSALIAGTVVALPTAFEARLGTAATIEVAAIRGVFYFAPLLIATPYLERWVLKRAGV
jgi:hypothetical protein